MKIIKAEKEDISDISKVAKVSFGGLKESRQARKWVTCNFEAYPRLQYFVAKEKSAVLGYILWMEKGGFRKEAVWELEQIAVHPDFRGHGIGTSLIKKSLPKIKQYLKERGAKLKIIEVTTGTENEAQGLYKKTLGAKVEATIKNLFRGDEVIMIARE